MGKVIHIVEPTLETEAGHRHSFLASLLAASEGRDWSIRLWVGKRAALPEEVREDVSVERYFSPTLRRAQEYFLYRRLLRDEGRMFIPTATRMDLAILDWAAGGSVPAGKAFLYFHWFRLKRGKLEFIGRIARRQPNLSILGPTESIVEVFRGCGFENAFVAPYPITPVTAAGTDASGFRHLVVAGAARQDKGFGHVVALLEQMAAAGREIPAFVQASPDHRNRVDPRVRAAIDRLDGLRYPFLTIRTSTLAGREYREQFRGGICLQPYLAADFADRISGITLDALSQGCPVVTVRDTWMGRVVRRFDAGKVVDDPSPERLLGAVEEIIREYPRYQRNARAAGEVLQRELSAARLFGMLTA